MIDKKSSNAFWEIKAFAILTVFYAHLVWTGMPDAGHTIYESIGCIGVPLFMLMAGFFDAKSRSSLADKIKRLFVPLLIWGTVTFCLRLLIDPMSDSSVLSVEYLKWVYGCGTWYYFIAVLFWCQVLVRFINEWVLVLFGVISMILTSMDLIPYNEILTPYNNPFNLILYFLIGRAYRLRKGDEIVVPAKLVWGLLLLIMAFLAIFKIPQYWNLLTPVFTVALFGVLWYLFYRGTHHNAVVKVGKMSLVLYLCHMQIAQALATRICSLLGGAILGNIVKVPVAFFFVVGLVYLWEFLLIWTKQKKLLGWLGYR